MTREEAKEILTHNWTRIDNPNYSESELDEAFFMAIEALSADAVQGEWIDNGIPDSILSKCSNCGYTAGAFSFNFCPNCGARMKSEVEE